MATIRSTEWQEVKSFVDNRRASLQYVERRDSYEIVAIDGPFQIELSLTKNPADSTNLDDFENNYKPNANSRFQNKAVNNKFVTLQASNHPNQSDKDDMVLDGSSSQFDFDYTPSPGEVWHVNNLMIVLGTNLDPNHNQFGAGDALSNGLCLKIQTNGVVTEICNIFKNIHITTFFHSENNVGDTQSNWLKDSDGRYFIGVADLLGSTVLDGDKGDFIRAEVKDDITTRGLVFMNAAAHVWREV